RWRSVPQIPQWETWIWTSPGAGATGTQGATEIVRLLKYWAARNIALVSVVFREWSNNSS
ncbi:MAG: hypothetical protein ACK5XD_02310, partial [Acidobacteriota bacterium]